MRFQVRLTLLPNVEQCHQQHVGGSLSARVPRSSAEVRRVFVHYFLEDEVDGQKKDRVIREKTVRKEK